MSFKRVLITGSAGFLGGYIVTELLNSGYLVYGIDNYSKYGKISRSYDKNPNYHFTEGDVRDLSLMKYLCNQVDHIIANASLVGGISYFHKIPFDILNENNKIISTTLEASLDSFLNGHLKKISVISSSMVYENATTFPTKEGQELLSPPPNSSYGFQKLAVEYYVKSLYEQYGAPYTILRPFNCVGIGERSETGTYKSLNGIVELNLSHVVPDLISKMLHDKNNFSILGDGKQVRHYTHGSDIARGIRLSLESDKSINEHFNISTAEQVSVLELVNLIWSKIYPTDDCKFQHQKGFQYDVQYRSPDVQKAETLLGFTAQKKLSDILDEVIPWIKAGVK